MNTTERILALGGPRHDSADRDWKLIVNNNNPLCGHWWRWLMENNPGGQLQTHNPDQWDEVLDQLAGEVRKRYTGGCGALD